MSPDPVERRGSRWDGLAEFVPAVFYVIDPVTGRNLYTSAYASRALGYADGQLPLTAGALGAGAPGTEPLLRRLLHPGDADRVAAHLSGLDDLADGETRTIEYRFRHAEGSWRWYESRDRVGGRDDAGRVTLVIGVAVDVSARREAEDALRQRVDHVGLRGELAGVLRSLSDPAEMMTEAAEFLVRHLATEGVDFADVDADGIARLHSGHHTSATPHHDGPQRLASFGPALLDMFRSGDTVVVADVLGDTGIELQALDVVAGLGVAAFVLVPLYRSGQPSAVMAVHQSVPRHWSTTEISLIEDTAEWVWSAAEQAWSAATLREREERYRALFTSIDEGFCLCEMITDDEGHGVDYRFLEVNARFEEQTGIVAATGRTALEVVPGLESHWLETYAEVALGRRSIRFENASPAMGRWFDVYAVPVGAPAGQQFAVVFNDITQRRLADEALRASETAERRARRRAEFLAELTGRLERLSSVAEQVDRLVSTLAPQVADYASVEIPGSPGPVTASSHRYPVPLLSTLSLPVVVGQDARGTLVLGLTDPRRRPYEAADEEFFRRVAERAGLVFTSSVLREEEHQIALRLQQALLPDRLLSHPRVELAAQYEAGSDVLEVGGDWYDTFAMSDARLGVSVGDVVGHGLEAAAAMGRLRTAQSALAIHAPNAGALLGMLDQFVAGPNGAAFATACCAVLDPRTGALDYASAGHPPMLVMSRSGSPQWLWDGRSRPLCGPVIGPRPHASGQLHPGDVLLLFSDGLVERHGDRISQGLHRLERTVGDNREAPLDVLCDRIFADMATDYDGDDDIVLLGLRFDPEPSRRLTRVLAADPAELAPLRAAVREWVRPIGLSGEALRRLLVTVGEAVGNSIEHGYRQRAGGRVAVDVCDTADALVVRIRDHGVWLTPGTDLDSRGRGTGIMTRLSDGYVRHVGRRGTTVHFRIPKESESELG